MGALEDDAQRAVRFAVENKMMLLYGNGVDIM